MMLQNRYNCRRNSVTHNDVTMLNQKSLIFVSNEFVSRSALAKQFLQTPNFVCSEFENIDKAVSYATKNRTSAILVDADFPVIDISKTSRQILAQGVLSPLIFLTKTSSHPANKIIDCSEKKTYSMVTKPFRFVQLSLHVKSVITRFEQTDAASLPLAHYIFHPALKTLTDSNEQKIDLTDKECDILEFLLFSTKRSASRELMLQHVWGYSPEADTHTIDTHVYKLRQKIEVDPNDPKLLISCNGGFRLNF